MRRTLLLFFAAAMLAACSPSWTTTNTPRTAVQQLLGTEATNRAVRALEVPDLAGRRIYVEVASPAAEEDREYLRKAVEARLIGRGAVVAEKPDGTTETATVLAGSLGTFEHDTFIGVPSLQSSLVPIASPELALYKSTMQRGLAKVELYVREPLSPGVLFHSGPSAAQTYWRQTTILFVSFHSTDT